MTDRTDLERRYRRWLSLYPASFRAEHEEEMLAVLLEGAEPGQTRPRVGEALDLAVHGLALHCGGRLPGDWEKRHASVMFPVRLLIAVWLIFVTTMLLAYHRGEPWAIVTIPAIVLHVWIAYRIRPRAVPR